MPATALTTPPSSAHHLEAGRPSVEPKASKAGSVNVTACGDGHHCTSCLLLKRSICANLRETVRTHAAGRRPARNSANQCEYVCFGVRKALESSQKATKAVTEKQVANRPGNSHPQAGNRVPDHAMRRGSK